MKKVFAVALAMTVAVGMLAGCGIMLLSVEHLAAGWL